MREIKFRGWLPHIEIMTYCHTLDELMNWNTKPEDNGSAIWLQYTGLKDRKRTEEYPEGQEIYEGDILHHKWNSGTDVYLETISEVKFSNGAFIVDDKKRADWLLSLHAIAKWAEIEVIGNIYENPELLEDRS